MRSFAPTRVLGATILAGAVILAGCTAPPDPKVASDQALKALLGKQASTTTFRVETTPEDLAVLDQAMAGDTPSAQAARLRAALQVIPKSSVTTATRAHEGTLGQATTIDKVDFATRIMIGDKPIEIVKVNNKGFLRIDVAGIGEQTGLFTEDQLRSIARLMGADKPWLNDLLDGKWMQADQASMDQFVAKLNQQAASASPQVLNAPKYLEVLTASSTVTKVNDTTYTVVTDAKALIRGLSDVDPNDRLTTESADKTIAGLNDGANLDTTLTIQSGAVTKVSIDVADILRTWSKPAEGPSGDSTRRVQAAQFKMAALFEFSDQADIVEPASATTIPAGDLTELLGGMSGMLGRR